MHARTHQLILDGWVPQAQAVEVVQQVLVDDGELAAQHAAHVDVGGVGLEALVVAQDLVGGWGGECGCVWERARVQVRVLAPGGAFGEHAA